MSWKAVWVPVGILLIALVVNLVLHTVSLVTPWKIALIVGALLAVLLMVGVVRRTV